jgi:hypothetical protein
MINKKLFNNNYNDTKQFADNEVIINWLSLQKQENEEKINSSILKSKISTIKFQLTVSIHVIL